MGSSGAPKPGRSGPRDRMARVRVGDQVWSSFRAELGSTPVHVALGELVAREVARRQRIRVGGVEEARVALEDARRLIAELEGVAGRLERIAGRNGARAEPG